VKKIYFILILNIIASNLIFSQYCSTPQYLSFNRQSQIDSFPINYPGCKKISGGIYIEGNDITNLNGFIQLNSIGGSLQLTINPSLTSLHGLDSLKLIQGQLYMVSNPLLTDFSGLDSLAFVWQMIYIANNGIHNFHGLENLAYNGGQLYISSNPNLLNLKGLAKISAVSGELQINDNPSLTSMEGLQNLQLTGDFFISGNTALASLHGLENLDSVGYLQIDRAAITDFDGLQSLTKIKGGVIIYQNPNLTNFHGLENLQHVSQSLDIEKNSSLKSLEALGNVGTLNNGWLFLDNNDSLENLTGLDNIDTASISDVIIQNSNLLSGCAVKSICGYLSNGGKATISANAQGCNSVAEVDAACSLLPVKLLSFTATRATEGIILTWQTANESSGDHFVIERSQLNTAHFAGLATINGKGNASQIQSYRYTDKVPQSGVEYYRLKIVDRDGNFSYSQIVSIASEAALSLYPNPTKDWLNIRGLGNSPSVLAIIDPHGNIDATVTINAVNYKWNIQKLPAGNYFLRILSNNAVQTLKFIKE